MTLNTNNNENKSEDKKVIRYRNSKQMAIGPLFSTLESTVTSQMNENEEDFIISKENQKIFEPKMPVITKDDDLIFLYDIFFKTRCYYSKRKAGSIDAKYSNKIYIKNGNNIYDYFAIKKYLIKLQKHVKINENSVNGDNSPEIITDNYQLQKMEDLITRYFLIIHILIRCTKFIEAKKLFLLIIKENFNDINDIENQIYINYTGKNQKVNISKDIPESTYKLLKIYSLIIRYSRLFNSNKYRNIFLSKYFKLQLLNLNFFMKKGIYRGFSLEIRNQINYIFSYCLHNAVYYCIENYLPINIPIVLNSSIISLYHIQDENNLTTKEKSLLYKSLYNQGLLYYIDKNFEAALSNLKYSKEKIISFGEDYDSRNKKSGRYLRQKIRKEKSFDLVKIGKKDSVSRNSNNINKNNTYNIRKDIIRKRTNNLEMDNLKLNDIFNSITNYNSSSRKISIISLDGKKSLYELAQSSNQKYEKILEKMNENLKEDKISINEIEYLLNFGKENNLLKDDSISIDKGFGLFGRQKERYSSFNQVSPSRGLRGSHIDFHTTIKIKNFNVPEKFENPLLRNIELLMCLIELQRKNYEASYAHILKILYIIIILKLGNNNNKYKYDKSFFNQQKILIDKYFDLIGKSYEINFKSDKITKFSSSDNNLHLEEDKEYDINNNNNDNKNVNTGSLIFKNKNHQNNNPQKYINNPTFDIFLGYNKTNNNSNNFNVKALLEFKKFFIFLSGLSLYQIKILNETQPNSDKRNNLPIIFSNQFKDCLSMAQRTELDNLHSMALNRFIILKNPNKWIMPSNLNISLINDNKKLESSKRKNYHLSRFEKYNYIDENGIQAKEYKNYLRIINSGKCSRDIKEFLIKNKFFIIKIIKDVDKQEIDNIVDYPYIIIEPIKEYKRKMKTKIKNTRNINIKNNLNIILRRSKNYKRMNTITINSKPMKNQIRKEIGKKLYKRNKSIASETPLLKTFIKKKEKNNNNSYDSFDHYTLNNEK